MAAPWTLYMTTLQETLRHAVETGMSAETFVKCYRDRSGDTVHTGHAIVAQVEDIRRILGIPTTPEFMCDLRKIGVAEHEGTTFVPGALPRGRRPKAAPEPAFTREEVATLFGQSVDWVRAHRESLALELRMVTTRDGLQFTYTASSVEAALCRHESTATA